MVNTTGDAFGAPDNVAPQRTPHTLVVHGSAADGLASGREFRVRIVDDDAPRPDEPDAPTLDDDGLLRFRGRWVPIPDTQIPVVDLLVRNLGRLVRNSDVRAAYEQAGGSGTATSLRSLVYRLGRRVGEVGLRVHVVRSRGLILDVGTA
jgi:hypothetical protein